MKYSIKVNEVKNQEGNLLGFATVVFGDSFKITNIAILKNRNGDAFVSMPRYKSSERDENNSFVYKNVCNPITKEFRDELYNNILTAYKDISKPNERGNEEQEVYEYGETAGKESLKFKVSVVPYQKEGSNIKGLARIYLENCFIINNVSVIEGKEGIFIAMPSYKTRKVDKNNKPIYQNICYPITKEFRERLMIEIEEIFEKEIIPRQEEISGRFHGDEDYRIESNTDRFSSIPDNVDDLPFR